MSLIELICPTCGHGLAPRAGQIIHACKDCHASWEAIAGRGLLPVARQIVRPRIAPPRGAQVVLVPVWCVALHRESLPEVADRMPAEIRVPATGIDRMPLLVECARRLTRAAAPREVWEGMEAPVDSAEIDAATAFAIAESVALRHVPGWPSDDQVASTAIPLGSAQLVDWPCATEGPDLVELVGGLSMPAITDGVPSAARSALTSAIVGLALPEEFVPTRANS